MTEREIQALKMLVFGELSGYFVRRLQRRSETVELIVDCNRRLDEQKARHVRADQNDRTAFVNLLLGYVGSVVAVGFDVRPPSSSSSQDEQHAA